MQACKFLDEKWSPKFTVIVAQKNHNTKFFQTGSPDNVPPGNNYKVCYHLHVSYVGSVLRRAINTRVILQVLLWTAKCAILGTLTSTCVHMLG